MTSASATDRGNLIATLDFFREGATYYKVTEKVNAFQSGRSARTACATGNS